MGHDGGMSPIPVPPIRPERVRRIAVVAAKGGGGLLGVGTALAGAAIGVIVVQVALARRSIGPRRTVPPYADGRYLPPGELVARGTSFRLAVLGDSGAAGLGADEPEDTPGAVIARELAAAVGRPVLLTNSATVGAQTRDLSWQVDRIAAVRPHVAVIMVGANDLTHSVRPQLSVRLLGEAVARLREVGCEVVVGTCPDLGTVKPLAMPLRQYARRMSRELAAAQKIAVLANGGRAVQLGELLGERFDSDPELYFSADRFHPSAAGYAACAHALLPEVLAALGLGLDAPEMPEMPALPSA